MIHKKDVQAGPKVYTTGAVAKITSAPERTVCSWFDRGLLKFYRVPGTKHRRVYEDVLVKFLLEHEMKVPDEMMARYKAAQKGGL